jgi:3-polyprenyl-4-hydroxybenzoate decarboxylase
MSATSRALEITVAIGAPTLYYYCAVHSGMGNSISTP